MQSAFADLTLILVLAASLGILARVFRQPTIVAYLAAGVLLAAFGFIDLNRYRDLLGTLATFGITLLLFLVGLEMRIPELRAVGRAAIIAGIGQVAFTAVVGFLLSRVLHFTTTESVYLALALTFSSTIIVVKLLSEKRDLQTLYGRIVVGILLIQDLVAIFLLIGLAGLRGENGIDAVGMVFLFLKGAALVFLTLWLGRYVLPWVAERLARTPELLFIASIAWAFGIATLVASRAIGFSQEIGGFLAGLALASTAQQYQIDAKIKPLRDFFIVIFFIVLGSTVAVGNLHGLVTPAIVLSLFVLIGNPIIVFLLMAAMGFRARTSFLTSVTVAQISEFSLILVALGRNVGHLDDRTVSLVTLVGVVTILLSTYFILHSDNLYRILKPLLIRFERKQLQEPHGEHRDLREHIVLIGAHRLGRRVLTALPRDRTVVIEYDPTIAKELQTRGYTVIFGDATDPEIQDDARLGTAAVVISTVPTLNDTLAILARIRVIRHIRRRAPLVIVSAEEEWQARLLYRDSADYVLLPRFIGGQHLANILGKGSVRASDLRLWRQYDLKELQQ